MNLFGDAAVGIDVIDGANGDDVFAGGFKLVKQGFAKGLGGKIAAVGRAGKLAGVLADKGAGNNAPDIVGNNVAIGNLAEGIKFIKPEVLLVGGNLDIAVGRGIKNGFAGGDMFFTKFLDNNRTGGSFVA